ncbi:MAG: sensor histidine kinase [Firmicutes bacterium]|nr:sensor histidine kinase [Bacillota bacterium]
MKKHFWMLLYLIFAFVLAVMLTRALECPTGDILSELDFVTYDNVLYSPDELRRLSPEQQAQGHVGWDYDYYDKEFSRVRTNVIRLRLTPGETYGLYTEQLTFASRLWIDGIEVASLGTVADDPAGAVYKTGPVAVYFTAGEENEIVMQRCNFMHAKWNAVRFFLGPQSVITRQVQTQFFRVTVILAVLFSFGLVNLGMFVGMPERRRFLWFSLASFSSVVHISAMDPKVIMVLLPDLGGIASYRTEGIFLILTVFFLMLFMRDCFEGDLLRWADPLGFVLMGLLFLIYLFVPTVIYTRWSVELSVAFSAYGAFYCLVIAARAFRVRKELTAAQIYMLGGIGTFAVMALLVILHTGPVHTNQMEIGLLLFELIITVALAMEYSEVRQAYVRSSRNVEQLRRMNESMEQNQELQENFMAIMNHEMRTPLTVIAGYADLSARQLAEEEEPDEEMIRNLRLVKQEALRLGRIVERSDEGARASIVSGQKELTDVRALFTDARDFCIPILEKNENRIAIDCPEGLSFSCIRDSMLQALYNMIINAGRHTKRGTITLSAREEGEDILISVADTGTGMDEETKLHAFERGYTRDGRRGIGLSLCREIAERHGGSIRIERSDPSGTEIVMEIPLGR